MKQFKLNGPVLALVLAAACLAACASPGRPEMMTITQPANVAAQGAPGYKAFKLGPVNGGGKTNAMWMSNVSGEDFQTALEGSLRAANYLADDPAQAKGEIKANMVSLDRPMAGLDLSVTTSVKYTVAYDGAPPVFDELVAAVGKAKFSEAFVAVERLRLANEASVRENITAFIDRLQSALAK